MPEAVEFDDIVESQQSDAYCIDLATQLVEDRAVACFLNENHALCRCAPSGNQLVVPASMVWNKKAASLRVTGKKGTHPHLRQRLLKVPTRVARPSRPPARMAMA